MTEDAPERGRRRQWPALVLVGVVGLGLVALDVRSRAADRPTTAPPVAASTPAPVKHLTYLALGDSLARGVQPDSAASLSHGYPRVLAASLRKRSGEPVEFVEAGCGGATTTSFIEGGKPCQPDAPVPYENADEATSQLAWAETALRERGDLPTLVTLTLGGNDLTECADRDAAKVRACLREGAAGFRTRLARIATTLSAAAGPRTVLVVATTYDPILGYLRLDRSGLAAVQAFHQGIVDTANPTIRRVFREAGWAVADVGVAMHEDGSITSAGARPVAAVCALTWACNRVDVHLNDEGYRVAADVFEAAAEARLAANYPALVG